MLKLNWKGGRRTFIEQFINIPFFLFFSPSSMVKLSINQQFFMIIRRFLGFVLKGFTRKNFLLSNVDGWTDPAWARRVSSSQARGRAPDGATIELNPGCKKLLRNGKKNIISCFFRLLWIFILGSIFFIFSPATVERQRKIIFIPSSGIMQPGLKMAKRKNRAKVVNNLFSFLFPVEMSWKPLLSN